MRILHFTHSEPDYIPPPRLSDDQVVAGPCTPNTSMEGVVRGVRTPRGQFDAAGVLERLSVDWRPDLVVVRVDAVGECRPKNLSALACPAMLVVGDTHHSLGGIRQTLQYALSEPFIATCLDYTRQHAHFFVEAGVAAVTWMPGFNVARVQVPECAAFEQPFTMVGQIGLFHVRRAQVMRAMRHANLPLVVVRASRAESQRLHATTQLNLNCSMNSDLNLRVLEVLQAGGALLTDRLAPESGLSLLAQDGLHLCTYASPAEAAQVADNLLRDKDWCRALGAAGRRQYESVISPEAVAAHFLSLADGRSVPRLFDVRDDARTRLIRDTRLTHALLERVELYEVVQMLHLQFESLTMLALPGVHAQMLADLVDLPRLQVVRDPGLDSPDDGTAVRETHHALTLASLQERLSCLDPSDARRVDLILAGHRDLTDGGAARMLDRHRSAKLLAPGGMEPNLAGFLHLQPVPNVPLLWQRLDRRPEPRFKTKRR